MSSSSTTSPSIITIKINITDNEKNKIFGKNNTIFTENNNSKKFNGNLLKCSDVNIALKKKGLRELYGGLYEKKKNEINILLPATSGGGKIDNYMEQYGSGYISSDSDSDFESDFGFGGGGMKFYDDLSDFNIDL